MFPVFVPSLSWQIDRSVYDKRLTKGVSRTVGWNEAAVGVHVPAPGNISVKRLKLRLSGSARKSQKRFRDTPRFKFQAVFVRIQPFQRSNERSEWGDHPVCLNLTGSHTSTDIRRSRYIGFGKMSSWGAVMSWGFTTERCSEEVRRVPSRSDEISII
jgi:hypothetical protein